MSPTTSMPMRAAIYARYSNDSQSEQSIDDQVRICRAKAEREGWSVVGIYADYAISGTVAARPQFERILTEARAGLFDVVLAEALDRISRDQEQIAGFYKQAELCWRAGPYRRRRSHLRASRRAEGHDGSLVPQGPRTEDAPRTGGAGACWLERGRPELWLSDCTSAPSGWNASYRCHGDRRG